MIRYFCDPFGKIFNFPPHTLSIAEAAPMKTSAAIDSDKEESNRQPITGMGQETSPVSVVMACPVVEVASGEEAAKKKKTPAKKKSRVKAKSIQIEKGEKKMEKKYHEPNGHHDKCCKFPEVPVVLKGFEWCDYKYYYEEIEQFEDYIKEYKCKYPCVLIHYEKVYPSDCKLRFCVFFNLCDYETAFEIEKKLQKIYRDMKMHNYER